MPARLSKYVGRTEFWSAGVCLVVACATLACSSADETAMPSHVSPPASTPASYSPTSRIAADLPLLNADINRGVRPAETVRLAYEFAARHPEVLKYVPCFCGCERGGHEGNDDCFVGARDKSGNVAEWETHGLICEVCIDVAEQAMKMHNSGAPVTAIRAAIEKRYEGRPTHTPTPMPPEKKPKTK
jgi:hypothetical protein